VSLLWVIKDFALEPYLPLVLCPMMDAWILDSEATSHMKMSKTKLFTSYSPSSIHYIAVADGSCVVGSVNFELQPCFRRQDVLHVPRVSHNLISIRKLTKDHNCVVIFWVK